MSSEDNISLAPEPGPPTGTRQFYDPRGNRLDVSWNAGPGRVRARVDYFDEKGRLYWTSSADLAQRCPQWTFQVPPAGNRNGTIRLEAEDGHDVLLGSLPVSYYGSIDQEISRWVRLREPEEARAGGQDLIQSGSAAPALPAEWPAAGCGWTSAGSVIQNPACPQELLRILAVRPPAPPLPGGSLLGFVLLPNPQELSLYQELSQLRTEPDGWSKMIAAATQFAAENPAFVGSLASLDTPASAYPFLVSQLRSFQGEVGLDEVLKTVDTFLFAFGVGPLDEYLASAFLKEIETRVWQSLFAVALGAPARPPLPDGLVGVLQVDGFLRELQRECLEGPPHALSTPQGRQVVLDATVLLPDGMVPIEPACQDVPNSSGSGLGWVQALGVGDLRRVYQCLKGYDLGEVAQVVNLMEHERLELSARELTRSEETTEARRTEDLESVEQEERASSSDLRTELEDVVAAEALCSQYNNLSQTYSATQVTLSGTWQGSESVKERSDHESRNFAEVLTRRAASRMAHTMTELRTRRHLREEERVDARDIDNRQGSSRLVGIYRWLHKIYEVAVRDADKRLVLELEIADPAADFLLHIRNLHGVHLTRPEPPEHYQVSSWEDVTPQNYLQLASLYRTEVPPPPPAVISVYRNFQSQPPVFQAELEVPEGYGVTTGMVQYLLGDASDNLVGHVGPAPVSYPNNPPTAILGLLQTPASTSSSGGSGTCPTLADPFTYLQVPFRPFQGSAPVDGIEGATGKIPASLLSTATWFSATVTLTCNLPEDSDLMKAWQIRTYDALVAGYLRCLKLYEAEIRARIGADSAADKRRIERRQLQQRAFRILWSRRAPAASPPAGGVPPDPPTPPDPIPARYLEIFERAFSWEEMTYAFHAWPPPPEPCHPDPCWPGQALIYTGADGLFDSFLRARSARALVPVRPGSAAAVLFYLHFGLPWPGIPAEAPAAEPDMAVLADLKTPPEGCGSSSWRLEIPTSMLMLQPGNDLPTFPCPLETTS